MDRLLWTRDMPTDLYPVPGSDEGGDDWTVSPDPDRPGWETDSRVPGYSIPRHVAEEICRRYNSPLFVRGETIAGYAGRALKGVETPIDTRTLIGRMEALGFKSESRHIYQTVYRAMCRESSDPLNPIRKRGNCWILRGDKRYE